jgi:uncharacterized repeat protein (TIGR01451 family)
VTVAVLSLLGLLGATSPAEAAAPPQLSIGVDDGQTDARTGSTLRYVVTVTNLGTSTVRHLAVSQTVPPGTTLGPVRDGGTKAKGAVRWTLDVPAGKSVTLRTSVEVGQDLAPDELRLATVACASTTPRAAPLVCASDSDQLPAGATAAEDQRHLEAAATGGRPAWLLPTGVAAGGLLLVGALVATGILRRRRGDAPVGRRLAHHEPR